MKLTENTLVGLNAILVHKLRTLLTMLGIIIGVASVIGMIAVGEGAKTLVMRDVEKVGGTNLLVVYRKEKIQKGDTWVRNPSSEYLEYEDAQALVAECPDVIEVVPVIQGGAFVQSNLTSKWVQFEATNPDFQTGQNWTADIGRFLSEDDLSYWTKACVIGVEVWRELFGKINPLGRELRISRNGILQRFTVVGVMEEKGTLFGDWNRDNEIFIPLTTAHRRFEGNDVVHFFWVKTTSFEAIDRAYQQVRQVLKRRHGGDEFFEHQSMKQFLGQINQISLVIKVMLGGIAAIALLVGGVGIMNIMLVAVTERTKEIGLRKALGAKRRDILVQFLVESVVMCLVGCGIGILMGWLMGVGMAKLVDTFIIKGSQWPASVSWQSVLIAASASASIGIFFGLYPAFKASKLQPVEALRHE